MSFINITLIIELLKDLLNLFLVVFVSGADEFIVRGVHQIPNTFYFTGCPVYKFLRCNTCGLCLFLNLLAVFIGSCLEKYVIAFRPFITGNRICQYCLISIANMRLS